MSTYTPVASQTLSANASTVTFDAIPQNYTDIIISVQAKWTGSGSSSFGMRFNADSGSNYSLTQMYGNGSSASSNQNSNQTQTVIGQITSTSWNSKIGRAHV